jgi:hypothetical protein
MAGSKMAIVRFKQDPGGLVGAGHYYTDDGNVFYANSPDQAGAQHNEKLGVDPLTSEGAANVASAWNEMNAHASRSNWARIQRQNDAVLANSLDRVLSDERAKQAIAKPNAGGIFGRLKRNRG